jgi:hypothetical protein
LLGGTTDEEVAVDAGAKEVEEAKKIVLDGCLMLISFLPRGNAPFLF